MPVLPQEIVWGTYLDTQFFSKKPFSQYVLYVLSYNNLKASTTYTNIRVLPSTVLQGTELEILEPLLWLML